MKRPELNEIPLSDALPLEKGQLIVTMNRNEWDELLQASYDDGWILIEVDQQEKPLRAYQRKVVS